MFIPIFLWQPCKCGQCRECKTRLMWDTLQHDPIKRAQVINKMEKNLAGWKPTWWQIHLRFCPVPTHKDSKNYTLWFCLKLLKEM